MLSQQQQHHTRQIYGGTPVGVTLGCGDGTGDSVGTVGDGRWDGGREGRTLGLMDGVLEGDSLGTSDGCMEGDALGTSDGCIDGVRDGAPDGRVSSICVTSMTATTLGKVFSAACSV
jgi:hypothetical protein